MNRDHNDRLELHKLRAPLIRYVNSDTSPKNEFTTDADKFALLIRYGAIGDMVYASPLPRLLKNDGYYVVVNTQRQGLSVLKDNPYIDEFWFQEKNVIPHQNLDAYWKALSEGFDNVINLTQSIEVTLLKTPQQGNYNEDNIKEIHDVNYYDHTMKLAGYDQNGLKGEIYFTEQEEEYAKEFMEPYKGKFTVLVVPVGSSISKAYPYWPFIFVPHLEVNGRYPANYGLYDEIPDLITITTGDDTSRLLEWNHPQNHRGAGKLSIRETLLLTKYVDLVIGPDTGFLQAAGCFDTPKICLFGHTTRNNIAKYWTNDYSIESPAECAPCYNMIYSLKQCKTDEYWRTCKCMVDLKPEMVIQQVKKVYKEWKRQRFLDGKKIIVPSKYERIESCQQLQM